MMFGNYETTKSFKLNFHEVDHIAEEVFTFKECSARVEYASERYIPTSKQLIYITSITFRPTLRGAALALIWQWVFTNFYF